MNQGLKAKTNLELGKLVVKVTSKVKKNPHCVKYVSTEIMSGKHLNLLVLEKTDDMTRISFWLI